MVLVFFFASPGCTFTFIGGCALNRAEDNIPGNQQLLMKSFVVEYHIIEDFIMLIVVVWY